MKTPANRIERVPDNATGYLEDEVVLRISRAGLRSDPPVVEFIGKVPCGACAQRMLWPA